MADRAVRHFLWRGMDKIFTDNLGIRDFLGQGGVGRVFLGLEQNLEREVAIKELIPEKLAQNREKKIARFIREAKLASQLQHPGIIPIYALSKKADGAYYYVMKYVHGRTLRDAIKDCNVIGEEEESFRRRMALLDNVIAVCDAMGYAHSKGVVHRDLKPANVVLGEFGETIILDWGLAKRLGEDETDDEQTLSGDAELDADAKLTRQGAILGTPAYLAPEQVDREWGTVDERTDVYTLGVILFMLLSGQRPHNGSARDVIGAIVSETPSPSPRELCSCIPPELTAICEKAMSKTRDSRFANASELASELKAYRAGRLVSVYAYSTGELLRRFVARNKVMIIAASAVVLSIIAGAGFSINFAVDAQRARKSAEQALVEVTKLSESSVSISRNAVLKLGKISIEGKFPKSPDEIVATIRSIFPFDPAESPYQVWCMKDDGYIIYDEDPKQIGRLLFTDEMYTNFPELLAFGHRMRDEPWGVGYYSFYTKDGGQLTYKVAAWDTFESPSEINWKIIVAHPYIAK